MPRTLPALLILFLLALPTLAAAQELVREEPWKAHNFYRGYSQNELRGDARFKDKRVRLEGRVGEVGRDMAGAPYIALRTNEWLNQVRCMFPKSAEKKLIELDRNQAVSVVGTCKGMTLGQLIFVNCALDER